MRRKEITTRLIELSERAKEVGFSQDVKEGDWEAWDDGLANVTIHLIKTPNKLGDGEFLILSFSRCLSWLLERSWHVDFINHVKEVGGCRVEITYIKKAEKSKKFRAEAKTHHEAITKAVVKMLEKHEG